MIPRLCGVFDISADTLLCIDAGKREENIRAVSEKAGKALAVRKKVRVRRVRFV